VCIGSVYRECIGSVYRECVGSVYRECVGSVYRDCIGSVYRECIGSGAEGRNGGHGQRHGQLTGGHDPLQQHYALQHQISFDGSQQCLHVIVPTLALTCPR
jgi:hypothetical protein